MSRDESSRILEKILVTSSLQQGLRMIALWRTMNLLMGVIRILTGKKRSKGSPRQEGLRACEEIRFRKTEK